ncbi:MAG: hypothetical protein LQ346_002255 [Caloplaca aetnensis]|nr:MAG: hypothetical protein LQ346_002255 [Caloplaca aetnensis]
MSPPLSGFPTVTPAVVIKLNVANANPHAYTDNLLLVPGVIHTGSTFTHFDCPSGTIESAEGFSPAFKAKVNFGADWCTFDADKEHGRLNLKVVARTEEGTSISLDYNGVIRMDEAAWKVFTMQPDAKTMAFGAATGSCHFVVGDEKLKALENNVFAGNGRIIVGENGLVAESRLCQIVPSTDMD